MRILLYGIILALLLLAPVERLDIAYLEPVQTLAVKKQNGIIELQTDTGTNGKGATVQAAVEDLESNASGVIYLDTAQYLLLTKSAIAVMEDLSGYLRYNVKVSAWDGEGSVAGAAEYLEVRDDLPKIHEIRTKVVTKRTEKNK